MGFEGAPERWVKPGDKTTARRDDQSNRCDNDCSFPARSLNHEHQSTSVVCIGNNDIVCSNMDASRDDHTKESNSERERQILYNIIYMRNPNYDTNEHIYRTETDSKT